MPRESTDPANAAYFGLAFTAALHPKLLGADLLIARTAAEADVHLLPGRRSGMKQHDRDRRRAVRAGRRGQDPGNRSADRWTRHWSRAC